MIMNENATL